MMLMRKNASAFPVGFTDWFDVFLIKGSLKNNLVEFALKFAVDLIDLIEQNRRNSELFRGLLRMKID